MIPRCQFSLRSLLLLVTLFATSIAAIIQVPHIFVFALSCLAAAASFWSFRRTIGRTWLRGLAVVAAVITCAAFYVLSLGPFIALSEFERKLTGQFHLGRLAMAWRPVMRLNHWASFRWYASRWIPPTAAGLHTLCQTPHSHDLIGTWQGEAQNFWDLRPDGTGRFRFVGKDRKGYFEWTCDGNEFLIYQLKSKQSAFAWFGRELMNQPWTDQLTVVQISPTQFKVRNKHGVTHSFTRVRGDEIQAVP